MVIWLSVCPTDVGHVCCDMVAEMYVLYSE